MEGFKEKIPFVVAIILAIFILIFSYYYLCVKENLYYTKIDNNNIREIVTSDNMKYEYCLDCYNEYGNKKEIKFKTSRKLKQDAYLMLEVINVSRSSLLERSFL